MKAKSPAYLVCAAATHLTTSLAAATRDVRLCGQYENVTDASDTYRLNTNVWGKDSSGHSCIEVTNGGSAFSTTWSWSANETLVHAFPNVNYNPVQSDPIRMSNLSAIDVRVSWSMKPEVGTSDATFDKMGLESTAVKTNVAFDVFFDTQLEKAVNTTAPSYEMMVWIGSYGSIQPIGAMHNEDLDIKKLPKQKIGKETFTLYQGQNDNGQYVFSWVASSNKTKFEADISPLVHYLWRHGMIVSANYIGVIQFGTEQKYATSNVTFTVDEFSINATRGTPKHGIAHFNGPPHMGYVCAIVGVIATFIF